MKKVRLGTPTRVRNGAGGKRRGRWISVPTCGVTFEETRAMRDVIAFWESYEYRSVMGPMNDATREMAVREYLLARAAFGGDFIELGRHFSVGVNYVVTGGRSTGGRIDEGDEVRYDIVLELYMHAPSVFDDDERRLLRKGVVMDTRNGQYSNVYVGPVRGVDYDAEKGTATILAGSDGDLFDVTFSLGPAVLDEVDERTGRRWADGQK